MPKAIQQLQQIKEFAQNRSLAYAKRLIKRLKDRASQLKNNDFDGRPIPEMNDPNIRQVLLDQYRIIYRIIDPLEAHILLFWHSSKPLDPDEDIDFEYQD